MSHRLLDTSMSAGHESSSGWQSVTITEGIINSKFSRSEAKGDYLPDTHPNLSTAGDDPPSAYAGLASMPHLLHAQHLSSIPHLAEVQEMHSRFLVSAGEIPESHLAEILPERRLEWMVAELGGIVGERRISIPLRGTTLGRVKVSTGEINGHPAMKLNLLDIDWQQTVTLPDDTSELTAIWDSGELHIGW